MKILLTSVFGPYGVDDDYGRRQNRMELFHNQVTREQGLFSLRFHHHSFGLYFIAENLLAPATVLDFPTEEAFVRELAGDYDYVGISFIVPNVAKARRMAELVRRHAPRSRIVLGGHGVSVPGIEDLVENDHICRGEGAVWFRRLLGEDPDRPFRHPAMASGFQKRVVGVPVRNGSAVLVPGVGCPNACRFCATSHFFGKTYTPYFDTGDELFAVMRDIEARTGFDNFFVMDENFLKRPERARRLLALMEEHGKPYRFALFSSAETIEDVGVEFLARLGVYFVWIGVESKRVEFDKNRGIDLRALVRRLREHGIGVLASGILFLEHHDPESIWEDIRFVVDLESDFVQFMQLGPLPGTRLYEDYDARGLLRKDLPYEEWHGQHRIWFRHPRFAPEDTERILREAFRYDYDRQGPWLLRSARTALLGARTLAGSGDPFLEKRRRSLLGDARQFRKTFSVLRTYAHNDRVRSLAEELDAAYRAELGPPGLLERAAQRAALFFARREARRLATRGCTSQPRCSRTHCMSGADLVEEALPGRAGAPPLRLEIGWGLSPLPVHLRGTLDPVNAKALARKLLAHLRSHPTDLRLVLDRLGSVEGRALERLLRRVRRFRSRVSVSFSEGAAEIRDLVASLPSEMVQTGAGRPG